MGGLTDFLKNKNQRGTPTGEGNVQPIRVQRGRVRCNRDEARDRHPRDCQEHGVDAGNGPGRSFGTAQVRTHRKHQVWTQSED